MSKHKGENQIEKRESRQEVLLLLPMLFLLTVFLFCVRGRIVPTYAADFFWFIKGEYAGDVYTYFRGQVLVVVTILAILYLLYCFASGQVKLEKHKIYIPMVIYAVLVLVSYLFSEYKAIAWRGFDGRYEGTMILLCYMPLLFYAMHAVRSEKGVRLIVRCFAVACFILGIWGILQVCGFGLEKLPAWLYVPSEMRKYVTLTEQMVSNTVNWFFTNQNYTSFFMVFPICIFAMSCIGVEDGKKKLIYAVLTGLMLFNLWQSASLGGMVGFAVAVVAALLIAGKENIVKWRKSIGLLFLAGIISVGASLPVILHEVGSASADIIGMETAYAEEAADAPLHFSRIESIVTDGSKVTFAFAEEPITITMENDKIKSITDGTGRTVVADNGLLQASTSVHEDSGYTLLNVDTANQKWTFADVEDTLYFVTPSGKLIPLHEVAHTGFEGNEDFATNRGYIWSRTLPLLKDTVLIGKGADTFAIYFPQDDYAGRYNIGNYVNGMNIVVDKPHNLYLGAAVNTGVLSMLALIVLFGMYLAESVKVYRKCLFDGFAAYIGMGIFVAVAGFMVSALVNDSTVQMMPVVYVLLGMGLAVNRMVKKERVEKYMTLMKYSVLMSVYNKEKAEFFRLSLKSMFEQTCPPEQVVVVCDGPLTKGLNEVLKYFQIKYPEILTVHRLKENRGTGYAANEGLKLCRNELIAKMDSDDISYADRCEKQLAEFAKNPFLDMLGGYVSEFEGDISNEKAIKKVPITNKEILRYARRRNPFNNQTLMYKKSKAIRCGGYTCNTRCEDYDFITKMILSGAKCENLPDCLVHYRLDAGAYERRKNWKNTVGFVNVRYRNWRRGFCSLSDFLIPCIAQMGLFLLPVSVTKKLYLKFLRK